MNFLRRNVNFWSFLFFVILVVVGICAVGTDYGKRFVSSVQERDARDKYVLKCLFTID